MIKAQELRLGNIIKANGLYEGKIVTVAAITEKGTLSEDNRVIMFEGVNAGEFISDCEAIPLAPEWLVRLGLVKDRNGWHLPNTQFSLTDNLFPCWLDKMLWPGGIPDFHNVSLQSVHQLQNLYYWLSGGEELKITSPSP
jgi:hypothetical protein